MTIRYGSMPRKKVGLERVVEPEQLVETLDVEDEPEDGPEQHGPEGRPERTPLGEDHEADGDPALAVHGLVAEPAR